jgi:hypothetical protein
MKIEIGKVYVSESGNLLRLESKTELMYNFVLVDENGDLIPEKRNKFGHVILRVKRQYSEEIVNSFKLVK